MLEKLVSIDRIEVLDNRVIQIRESTKIAEDGKVLSQTFNRCVIEPGQQLDGQPDIVRLIAKSIWTDDVVDAYTKNKILNT